MRKFKLSVAEYRDKLQREFGYVDESLVKNYAIAKAEWLETKRNARKSPDLKYNIEVLERMIETGCRPCEIRAQEKYIEKLKNEQIG